MWKLGLVFLIGCGSVEGSSGENDSASPDGCVEYVVTNTSNYSFQECLDSDNVSIRRKGQTDVRACVTGDETTTDLSIGDRVCVNENALSASECVASNAIEEVLEDGPATQAVTCTITGSVSLAEWLPNRIGVSVGAEGLPNDPQGVTSSLWDLEVPSETIENPQVSGSNYTYVFQVPTTLIDMAFCDHKLCPHTDFFIDVWYGECGAWFTYMDDCELN